MANNNRTPRDFICQRQTSSTFGGLHHAVISSDLIGYLVRSADISLLAPRAPLPQATSLRIAQLHCASHNFTFALSENFTFPPLTPVAPPRSNPRAKKRQCPHRAKKARYISRHTTRNVACSLVFRTFVHNKVQFKDSYPSDLHFCRKAWPSPACKFREDFSFSLFPWLYLKA